MKAQHSDVHLILWGESSQLQVGKHDFINLLLLIFHYLWAHSLFFHFLQCNFSSDLFSLSVVCVPPSQWFTAVWYPICWFSSTKLYFLFTPCCLTCFCAHCKFTERIWGAAFRQCSAEKQQQLLHGTPHQHPSTPCSPSFLLLPPSLNQLSARHQYHPPNPNPSQSAVYPKCFTH